MGRGPIRIMNESEWNRCTNAAEMILYLWSLENPADEGHVLSVKVNAGQENEAGSPHRKLITDLHRYYLASCRRIWKLLPQKYSQGSVELGELRVEGKASDIWLHRYDWYSEAAAFRIDYAENEDEIADVLEAYHAIPRDELRTLLYPPETADRIEPRELMTMAAYFANHAMNYAFVIPKDRVSETIRPFLDAELLRRFVKYPGTEGDSDITSFDHQNSE